MGCCYSQSKALATQAVLDAAEEGLNACVIHPSGIHGPEDFAVGETTKVLIQIINGEMPAGIDGSFNLCDVRNLAHGAILAADKGQRGQCYILGNDEVSFRDFARNNNFDSSKARKELGYTTRSYRETMHDEIEWLKASGKIA